jgi:hypothetical protein
LFSLAANSQEIPTTPVADTPAGQEQVTRQEPATSTEAVTSKDAATSNEAPQSSSKHEGTSDDRLFFVLPNFLTLENGSNVPPLTAGQKFSVVARSASDKIQICWYAFLAGIGQAQDQPKYGQGMEGYGKRFASAAADGIIENFMNGAVFPSLLHQDPRFFQMGHGTFWHRTGYALSRIVITRTDSGHSQFNFSEVLGSGAAAAISTYSYHPSVDQTPSNTAKVWGTQAGYDTITLVIKEFWPDIRRRLHKKK